VKEERGGRCLAWSLITKLFCLIFEVIVKFTLTRNGNLKPVVTPGLVSWSSRARTIISEQNGWPRQPGSRGAHALMCVSVRLHHVCPRPCHPYDYMSALLSALRGGGVTVEMKAAPTARPWAH
jgi:hypothetical protein